MATKYVKISGQYETIDHFKYQKDGQNVIVRREYVKKDGDWKLVFENLSPYNYGYVCGGMSGMNFYQTIDRFEFPLHALQTTTYVSDLTVNRAWSTSNNSSQYGYIHVGHTSIVYLSSADRFLFELDIAAASISGNLSSAKRQLSSVNDSINGYVCGGMHSITQYSEIDKFAFPFNSSDTAIIDGNLSGTRKACASTNATNYGYICGGDVDNVELSTIDRFSFTLGASSLSVTGELTSALRTISSNNSSQHSYIYGGRFSDGATIVHSTIQRFMHPLDAGTANIYAYMTESKYYHSANNSTIYGFVCGGQNNTLNFSTVERLLFSLGTNNAEIVSNLTGTRYALTANDSTDFLNQFIAAGAFT